VYVSDGNADANMHLYVNAVAIGDEHDGIFHNVDLSDWDNDNDATNMLYTANTTAAADTVTYDNVSSDWATNVSSRTWSHTTGSGKNRMMIVGVGVRGGVSVTSATYNGDNLTKIRHDMPGSDVRTELWYLANPDPGTHDVVVNFSGAQSVIVGALTWFGVHPTLGTASGATCASSCSTLTVSVTSASGEVVVDAASTQSGSSTLSVGADQTPRVNVQATNNNMGMSHENGVASTTMSWTQSASEPWAISAVPLKPADITTLSIESGIELHVHTGDTFIPNGDVDTSGTGNIHLDDSSYMYIDDGSSSVGGDLLIDGGATFDHLQDIAINGGDITTSGTTATLKTTIGSPTLAISGTGTIGGGTTPSLTFNNVATSGSGTTTLANSATALGDVTVGSGTNLRINANFVINGGDLITAGTSTIDTTSGTPTVTLSGSGTLGGGSGDITIYNLQISGAGSTFLDSPLTTTTHLTIGDGSNAHTFNNETHDEAIIVGQDLIISANGTFTASSSASQSVGRSWSNDGTFNEGTGTITFNTANAGQLDSGCSSVSSCTAENFYRVVINKASSTDTVTLLNNHLRVTDLLTITQGTLVQGALNVRAEGSSAVSVDTNGRWNNVSIGDLILGGSFANAGITTFQGNGASCGDADDISITSTGAQRSWTGSGTFNFNDVSVQDQGGSASITVYDGTNVSGNGANWTFSSCPGGGPNLEQLLRHGGWFNGSGQEQPFTY
jgi:hypothetical protein